MKRSEVIKYLEEVIDNSCGNDGIGRLYPSDNYLASVILNKLEEIGMLPPESQYNEGMGRGWVTHNVWEPENE